MGTTFKYISDGVLSCFATSGICTWCEEEADLFLLWIEESDDRDSTEACVNCIKTVPLSWIYPKDDERKITSLINERYPKGTKSQQERFALTVEMCDVYRRTPLLPNFAQTVDWPSCCGDFAEFIGDAGHSYNGTLKGFEWWGYEEDMAIDHGIEGMMGHEDPVSLFSCIRCPKRFWTFQTT